MTSFQDVPDENIEHDEKMELRSTKNRTEQPLGSIFLNLKKWTCQKFAKFPSFKKRKKIEA